MALDTVGVTIPHHTVRDYLNKLDERGETYEFIVGGTGGGVVPIGGGNPPLELSLHRDGTDDPLTIVMRDDGTWYAKHVLVVGERL